MRDMDEQRMDDYRFISAKEASFEDVTSDIKEPVCAYRKRDHAVTKEIAKYKYEAANTIKDIQRRKLIRPKPIFDTTALMVYDHQHNLSVNDSFQGLESIHEKAFRSLENANILQEDNEGEELIKENNRSHMHYLDAHRDGMERRSSKHRLPKLKVKQQIEQRFRIKPLKNPIKLTQDDGTEYPIENNQENRLLIKMSEGRDFSHLNLWSKVQDVKRHYKRIKIGQKRRRMIERKEKLDEALRDREDDVMFTDSVPDDMFEKELLEDSESEDEEVKLKKEQEIIQKVLSMRGSRSKFKQLALEKSKVLTERSNTIKADRIDTDDGKTSGFDSKRRPQRVDSMKTSILRGNSFIQNSFHEPVKEADIEVEANDIVLDLPMASAKYLTDVLGNTNRSSSACSYSGNSPGMTRAQQHQAKLAQKIDGYNKYKMNFEGRYMHDDSSKRLKYEYELTKPMNPRHFRNLIDEPQYLRKKKQELKKLEQEAKMLMEETLQKSPEDSTRNETIANNHSNLYNSVVEYREKKTQSTLQTIAERGLHHYSNSVNKRAEHNYNTYKRNKLGPQVTNSMLSNILHQISLDVSKL